MHAYVTSTFVQCLAYISHIHISFLIRPCHEHHIRSSPAPTRGAPSPPRSCRCGALPKGLAAPAPGRLALHTLHRRPRCRQPYPASPPTRPSARPAHRRQAAPGCRPRLPPAPPARIKQTARAFDFGNRFLQSAYDLREAARQLVALLLRANTCVSKLASAICL